MSEKRITQILDNSFGVIGIKTLTIQENAFISGHAFTHSDYTLSVATGAVINYLFDPTACTCDQVIAEVPIFNSTAGPVTVEFYSAPTTTANGTELLSFNRRSGGAAAEAKLYVGPTITDDGTRFSGLLLPATAAVQGNTGDQTIQGLPFEVSKTTKVLIRITNTNGDGVDIGRRFDWIEA
jgi:hypothetical protein